MNITNTLTLALILSVAPCFAQESPIDQALKKEGALPNLPVSAAKEAFTPEFVQAARDAFGNLHWQMAGDHALYYNLYMSEFMATGIASPNMDYRPLARDIRPELEDLTTDTGKGTMTLKTYAVHPHFRLQAMIFVHKGKVVYETYPGMKPSDRKIWTSAAKTTVGLVLAMLMNEGKVALEKPVTDYVPELKGSVWDDVTVYNVVNMATALDNEETGESIMNPDSAVVRFFASGIVGAHQSDEGRESWLDVARDEKKLPREKPDMVFRYASMNTQVLTKLVENVENKTWTKVFEERVWSKMYARQPAFFNLTTDGLALPVGFLSTTPEDMVRYATLFTPSWEAVASERVVTPELLKILRSGADPKRYPKAAKRKSSMDLFNEYAIANSYHFDFIFEDGAMAKSGNMNQMIYMDPKRDFAAIAFSNAPYHSGFGESKAPAYMRLAAKALAGE